MVCNKVLSQLNRNARETKKTGKNVNLNALLMNVRNGKYRFIIGIDTGTHTGFAVWDKREKSFALCTTFKIHEAINYIQEAVKHNPDEIFVRFEDARQRTWYNTHSEREDRAKLQGAGSIKRDCTIWEDFLTDIKVPFEMVAPKRNATKLSAEQFKQITHYTGKTSEHARDAAMLVYGL